MTYLQRLKIELTMSHSNDGWYNKWIKEKINQIKLKHEKSDKNN